MQSWKYARVAYQPPVAELIAARIQGWAAMADTIERGPGLAQDDAVQFVTDLAMMRHYATNGARRWRWAIFSSAGNLDRVMEAENAPEGFGRATRSGGLVHEDGRTALPVVGDERYTAAPTPGGDGELGADWGRTLALAIDGTIGKLANAERSGTVPQGYGGPFPGGARPQPGAAPAVVAIIVGGAAVAVIGTAAAWRYFAPQVRQQAAAVRAAAKAYQARLEAMAAAGQYIAPSPLETLNANRVREAAGEASSRNWLIGGAAVGGIAGGAAGMAYLRNRMA